jgi:ABC-type multidrug transport system ATPase subunit
MNDNTTAAVAIQGLQKSFGEVTALDGLDLEVQPGTVFGLLGPNGAGKTTLVRVLATLLEPDGGRATVFGHDIVAEPLTVRRRIGLAGQFAAVDGELTGRENLEMIGRLYRLPGPEARRRASEVLERFRLSDAADRRVATYSGGMRRRLELGASLVGRPPRPGARNARLARRAAARVRITLRTGIPPHVKGGPKRSGGSSLRPSRLAKRGPGSAPRPYC